MNCDAEVISGMPYEKIIFKSTRQKCSMRRWKWPCNLSFINHQPSAIRFNATERRAWNDVKLLCWTDVLRPHVTHSLRSFCGAPSDKCAKFCLSLLYMHVMIMATYHHPIKTILISPSSLSCSNVESNTCIVGPGRRCLYTHSIFSSLRAFCAQLASVHSFSTHIVVPNAL